MKIYRENEIIADLPVDESAVCLRKLMDEHSIKCNVAVAEPLDLKVGDQVREGGVCFTLTDDPGYTHSGGTYSYALAFYAPYYKLNYVYYREEGATKFDYSGGVREHLTAWLDSVHESDPEFTLGAVDENGTQHISFDKTYCLPALVKICEAFQLEYEIDNKVVNVKKRVGSDTAHIFEYGRDKGLYALERQGVTNRSVVTKLTGKGSTSNLPPDYRAGEDPRPDTLVFEGRFLTLNTEKYGIREDEKVFDDIYPRLKDKKVLAVESPVDVANARTWTLKLDIPFDLDAQLAPGKEAQVHFTSGELQGESFAVVANSFNPETKELKILTKEQDGYTLPRPSREPHVGDAFVLLDIIMPYDPYVTEAEAELEERTREELNKTCVPQFAHKLTIQPRFIRDNGIRLQAGDKVTVKDKADGLDVMIRITEVSYPMNDPNKVTVLLSDEILYSYEEKIRNDINDITGEVADAYRQIQNTSRRAWKDARELANMIRGLETELLLIGNPEGQFTTTCVFKTNKNNNPNSFVASAGTLQHKVYTDNAAGGVWQLDTYNMALDADVPYFLYARCSKANNRALFVVSSTEKEVEDAGYYYFRVGLISSIFENARIINTTNGFTQIAGGNITAEKLQDAQRRLVIDLTNAVIEAREGAVIRGKIEFKSINGDYKDAETVIDEKTTAVAKDEIGKIQIGGVNLLDGSDYVTNREAWNALPTVQEGDGIKFVRYGYAWSFSTYLKVFKKGNTYTWSGLFRSIDGGTIARMNMFGETKQIFLTGITGQWQRLSITFKLEVDPVGITYFLCGSSNTIDFAEMQIEEGNKATAWSPSLADQEKAVQDVKDLVQTITDDDIFSSTEKKQLLPEWNNILNEKTALDSNAVKYAVTAEKNAYQAAYTALFNYVNPLMVKLNTNSPGDGAAFVGTTFRDLFSDFYKKRTALQNKLTDAAKQYVDAIQVGGTNYLNGSRFDTTDGWIPYGGTVSAVVDEKYGKIVEFSRPGGGGDFQKRFDLPKAELANTELVYYMIAKQIGEGGSWQFGGWNVTYAMLGSGSNKIDLGGGWYQYWVTFKSGDTIGDSYFGINSIKGTWRFYAAGVLKGNKATAWSPSLADQQAQIDNIQPGTRNLLTNRQAIITSGADVPGETSRSTELNAKGESETTVTSVTANNNGNAYRYAFPIGNLSEKLFSGYYVFSFDYKTNHEGGIIKLDWRNPVLEYTKTLENTNGEWRRGYFLCDWTNQTTQSLVVFVVGVNNRAVGNYVAYRNIKLVRGNKGWDDSPAPEDIETKIEEVVVQAESQAYLKEAFRNTTTVEGGLVATTLLKLGATSAAGWIEKAGVNGAVTARGNNDIRFYAGGDLASAIRLVDNAAGTKATFAVTQGGKLFATNVDITGKITATSGEFTGKIRSSASGNRIELDPASSEFALFNSKGEKRVIVGFDEDDIGRIKCIDSSGSVWMEPNYLAMYNVFTETSIFKATNDFGIEFNLSLGKKFRIHALPSTDDNKGSDRNWRILYYDTNSGDIAHSTK